MKTKLYRIITHNAVAGILVNESDKIVHTAPILRSWLGVQLTSLIIVASSRGWQVEELS